MAELFLAAVFGLIGGLLRAIVGFVKNKRVEKQAEFKVKYFVITILIAGLIGTFLSLAFVTNYILNLVIGYAGIDLLENLVKIIKKK